MASPTTRDAKPRRWLRPSIYLLCCGIGLSTYRLVLDWIASNLGHGPMIVAVVLLTLAPAIGAVWALGDNATGAWNTRADGRTRRLGEGLGRKS